MALINRLVPFCNRFGLSSLFNQTFVRNKGNTKWHPQPIHEISRHRTRPPTFGLQRKSKLRVVDNSSIGKEAMVSSHPPYCMWVYKPNAMYHKRHMAKAFTGDKILVGVGGEMKKAYVVGANTHTSQVRHGRPTFDTNNVVLLENNGNPIGNRILVPIPSWLKQKRTGEFAKVLAIATKFY